MKKKNVEQSLFVNDCFQENLIEVLWSIQAELKEQTKLIREK
jgi:hypothetical protein